MSAYPHCTPNVSVKVDVAFAGVNKASSSPPFASDVNVIAPVLLVHEDEFATKLVLNTPAGIPGLAVGVLVYGLELGLSLKFCRYTSAYGLAEVTVP